MSCFVFLVRSRFERTPPVVSCLGLVFRFLFALLCALCASAQATMEHHKSADWQRIAAKRNAVAAYEFLAFNRGGKSKGFWPMWHNKKPETQAAMQKLEGSGMIREPCKAVDTGERCKMKICCLPPACNKIKSHDMARFSEMARKVRVAKNFAGSSRAQKTQNRSKVSELVSEIKKKSSPGNCGVGKKRCPFQI